MELEVVDWETAHCCWAPPPGPPSPWPRPHPWPRPQSLRILARAVTALEKVLESQHTPETGGPVGPGEEEPCDP